jgi:ssDNA-binding replication factor A large subunit
VIKKHLEVEDHEIVYADGGATPLQELKPMMKGNWRIKIRVTKKGEVKTWQNAKGEG